MRAPKAILVPLSYPDYPREVVDRFIKQSADAVRSLGIDLAVTEVLVTEKNIEAVRKALRENEFDFTIPLIVSWHEAPNVVAAMRDVFDRPMLLWTHTTYREGNETLTLGPIPAAGVLRETFEEMGARFKFIYGMPDSPAVRRDIASYARTALAVTALSRVRVGLFGYISMGMYTAGFDHTRVRSQLGPEVVHLDQYRIIKRVEEADAKAVAALVAKARKEWDLTDAVDDKALTTVMKMYLALRTLVQENALDAVTVKCQYELSRIYGVAPCIPLSMLGDDLPCSCEGDMPLILSQIMLHYLTGGAVTTYGDAHEVLADNSMLFAACGFAPLCQAAGRPKVSRHTALYEGLLNMSPYKDGPVTLARLASDGAGYKMHIATGTAGAMPPFHEINCPTYAGMKVCLDGSADHFMQNLMSQHYGIVYGNVRNELLELCRWLSIRVVESR